LLESEPETVVRLGQARVADEGGALLSHGILRAPGVKVDEAEVARDPRVVGIEAGGRLKLRGRLGQTPRAVQAESGPCPLYGLGPLDRRRSRLRDRRLARAIPRAAVGVDEQRVDGQQGGVPLTGPFERRD